MMGKFTRKEMLWSKRAAEKFTLKRMLLRGSLIGILAGATVLAGCTSTKTTDTEISDTEEKSAETIDFFRREISEKYHGRQGKFKRLCGSV